MSVVDLLDPQRGEKILDLGCGDGTLAVEIEKLGARVVAVQHIYSSLKKDGRFVAELGGYGNVEQIVSAMGKVFARHEEYGEFDNPWFFPKQSEYKELLEDEGFVVEYIELIPRPTPIDDISNWLGVFANGIAQNLTPEQKEEFIQETREILKDKIYTSQDA